VLGSCVVSLPAFGVTQVTPTLQAIKSWPHTGVPRTCPSPLRPASPARARRSLECLTSSLAVRFPFGSPSSIILNCVSSSHILVLMLTNLIHVIACVSCSLSSPSCYSLPRSSARGPCANSERRRTCHHHSRRPTSSLRARQEHPCGPRPSPARSCIGKAYRLSPQLVCSRPRYRFD
jgi:hypothetical protein